MSSIKKHSRGCLYSLILVAGVFLSFWSPAVAHAGIPEDKSAAVIFVYHHVGEDTMPSSNISLSQFREHIREMTAGGYNVLPLPQIVAALKNGDPLPPKTVAITFEGAWLSTFQNAIPLLEDAHLPFTLFFSSDIVDDAPPNSMTWKQLKNLKKNDLVTLGILPATYVRMTRLDMSQNAALINKAVARYRDEFGTAPTFFAYPYGEYSAAIEKQVSTYNFSAAFAQQSGVAYPHADFLALPRFTMTDNFGDLDRFQLTANALPLPVSDIIPEDPVVTQNPPMIGFTVTPEIKNIAQLSCFVSDEGKIPLTKLGGGRVEIRLQHPLEDRRTRINCTMPDDTVVPGEPLQWRWFGMEVIVPGFKGASDTDTGTDDNTDESR